MRGEAGLSPKLAACLAIVVLVTACSREVPPEAVALEYARALYAQDRGRTYRLLSAQDRAQKPEAAFMAEGDAPTGNALGVARHLASFIEIVSAEKKITGDRAEVKLKLRLPNANAAEVAGFVRDWDAAALNAISDEELERIRKGLDELHRSGGLPTLEGEEGFELVREDVGWRVVVNWEGGVRVHFRTRIPAALAVRAAPEEQRILVKPGEKFQMGLRLTNTSGRELSLRVAHDIEPKAAAPSVVFVQCPLLLPVQLPPGESREYSSTLMIAGDVPDRRDEVQVTFTFRSAR
jgi:hypothetical protein